MHKMRIVVLFLVVCVLDLISTGSAQYVFSSIEDKYGNKGDYNEYQNMAINGIVPYYAEWSVLNYHDCIRDCDANRTNCKSINIITHSNKTYSCYYFDTAKGSFIEQEKTVYVSKYPAQCSHYCRELSYMNLCGRCRCVDKCNSKFSHYCDCTKALKQGKKDCKEVKQEGFTDPALYNIQNQGGEIFKGFCERRENGTLWLTMMRKFTDTFANDKKMEHYVNGFGNSHDELYWLGLEHVYQFTRDVNTILRVQVATFSNEYNWFGEYGNFKLTKNGAAYGYTATDYRTNYCLASILKEKQTKEFGECGNARYWFDNCAMGSLFKLNQMKVGKVLYTRVAVFLRHGSLPPLIAKSGSPTTGIRLLRNNYLGTISYLGRDYCISFDLYTKAHIYNTNAILLINDANGNIHTLFYSHKDGGLSVTAYNGTATSKSIERFANINSRPWINIKMSQIKFGNKKYLLQLQVDGVSKISEEILTKNVKVFTNLRVYGGCADTNHQRHNGMIQNLYINGVQYQEIQEKQNTFKQKVIG